MNHALKLGEVSKSGELECVKVSLRKRRRHPLLRCCLFGGLVFLVVVRGSRCCLVLLRGGIGARGVDVVRKCRW